jgi:hypothetical protein
MIQVFFFGPDYVAMIPDDGERVVLTINEAMGLVRCIATGSEGIVTYRAGASGEVERFVYPWSTPELVKTIIGDHRFNIFNNYTINKNRTA